MPRLATRAPAAAIVESAASLYAMQGMAKTSLQDVADALGVSKAAVLHHFGSKAGLELRVKSTVRALIDDSVAPLRSTPVGARRDALAVKAILDCALAHPGIVAYGVAHADDPQLGGAVLCAFDDHPAQASTARTVRVIAALAVIGMLTSIVHRDGTADVWRPFIVQACLATLHGTSAETI